MFIEREILPHILHWIDRKKILILKGSRQVGKTTLLKVIKKRLEDEGKTTFYLSIDQEFSNPILENSQHFFHFLNDQFPHRSIAKKLYLFLDEFQYLPHPGIFLKTLFDLDPETIQIIVSGSSSLEITKNSEFLTGRKIEFSLYPLNYREFLAYKTKLNFSQHLNVKKYKELKEFFTIYQTKVQEYFSEYLSFGGYPEVVTTKPFTDKVTILKELVKTYIEKDIIAFLRIENVNAFGNLLKILCDQTGNLVNKSELSHTLNISMDTVNKYLDILEGTYVIELLRPFFSNLRKELSKMPKVYIGDTGMKNTLLNKIEVASIISGAERENFIYNSLKSRYPKENIKFYRTISKAEIDFILEIKDLLIPIEVKSTKKRIHLPASFHSFSEKYKKASALQIIITDDFLDKEGTTFYIPISLFPFIKVENLINLI